MTTLQPSLSIGAIIRLLTDRIAENVSTSQQSDSFAQFIP